MPRTFTMSERRYAEKLTILVDRGEGLLNRLYNAKKSCQDSSTRPSVLSEKVLEPVIKTIIRRFPNIDVTERPLWTATSAYQRDIAVTLSVYYNIFVDVMNFKDTVNEVITDMASFQFYFNIKVNYDLARSLLELVSQYASMMILLGRIDDSKVIIGLYNIAHDSQRGTIATNFPRVAQMILEYDNSIKKLTEEFVPLSKMIVQAVMSLTTVYLSHNLTADQLREHNMLSISNTPHTMLRPTVSGTLPCEYISLEAMHQWISFGFLLCCYQLNTPSATDLWKLVLQDGYALTLHRDECILVHSVFEKVLQDSRNEADRKKSSDVSDALNHALQKAGPLHRERREYLRTALSELVSLLSDSPGLLGPKAITVLKALTLATDEVHWLYKHTTVSAPKAKSRVNPDDYSDQALPELLFYIVKLKALMRTHHRVIANYYMKYMSGYDAKFIKNLVMQIEMCPEDWCILATSFVDTLMHLQGKETEELQEGHFKALRLDWFRLQALSSFYRADVNLRDPENWGLALAMNSVVVHSKLVSDLEELLIEQADLSFICFFYQEMERQFNHVLKSPTMIRYITAYPMISAEFLNCCSPLCPEERIAIGERSVNSINHYLETIAKEVQFILGALCSERISLDDQVQPYKGSAFYLYSQSQRTKQRTRNVPVQPSVPGKESYLRITEDTVKPDSTLARLVSISFSVNCFSTITAWDHVFSPREYLVSHLEDLLTTHVMAMLKYNSETQKIARPSEVLANINTYMSTLRNLELHVNIDMTRVITAVLLQQTQSLDSKGEDTVASIYTSWYLNRLLKTVSDNSGSVCYSRSRKCFVSSKSLSFKAENYTDITELQALAKIIGPYGILYMGEKMMEQVGGQLKEIKKLVVGNQDTLLALHTNRDKPEIFTTFLQRLKNSEDLIGRTTIVGVILAFRKCTLDALNSVLGYHVPFMLNSISIFKKNIPDKSSRAADQLAEAAGIQCDVDPLLFQTLQAYCDKSKEDYTIWSLFLVYMGIALPKVLATNPNCTFIPYLEGHQSNIHCVPIAVSAMVGAIFTMYGETHQKERMKEFIVFMCTMMANEAKTEKKLSKARESIHLLLDQFLEESSFPLHNHLEEVFPYALRREAFISLYRKPSVTEATF